MQQLIVEQLRALQRECEQAKSDSFRGKEVNEQEEARRERVLEFVTSIGRDFASIVNGSAPESLSEPRQLIAETLQGVLNCPISRVRSFAAGSLRFALSVIEGRLKEPEGRDVQQTILMHLREVEKTTTDESGVMAEEVSTSTQVAFDEVTRQLLILKGRGYVEHPDCPAVDGQPLRYLISVEGLHHLEDIQQI